MLALLGLCFLFSLFEDRRLEAQKPLAEIAQRFLPLLQEQAKDRAQGLSRSAEPALVPQWIEYPSVQFRFYDSPDGKLEAFFDPNRHTDVLCIPDLSDSYRGGADDPGQVDLDNFFGDLDKIELHPHVDVRRVKSIIIVLFRTAEAMDYTGFNPKTGNSWTEVTVSEQVFVINRENMNVTAYRSFAPDAKLPTLYSGQGGACAINQRTEAAQVAWLNALNSTRPK